MKNKNYKKHYYPKSGEELSVYQPRLEFYDGRTWVPSGINSGRCSDDLEGKYRFIRIAK